MITNRRLGVAASLLSLVGLCSCREGERAAAKEDGLETAIEVLVVDEGTRQPLPAIRMFLDPGDRRLAWGATQVFASTARLGESPISDANGSAKFVVSPRIPFVLVVLGAFAGRENVRLNVPPLQPGETRLVEVPVELAPREPTVPKVPWTIEEY